MLHRSQAGILHRQASDVKAHGWNSWTCPRGSLGGNSTGETPKDGTGDGVWGVFPEERARAGLKLQGRVDWFTRETSGTLHDG